MAVCRTDLSYRNKFVMSVTEQVQIPTSCGFCRYSKRHKLNPGIQYKNHDDGFRDDQLATTGKLNTVALNSHKQVCNCTQGISIVAFIITMRIKDLGVKTAADFINFLMNNCQLQKIRIPITL
jgi:hypothetical protein